jgi:hypothetical protein
MLRASRRMVAPYNCLDGLCKAEELDSCLLMRIARDYPRSHPPALAMCRVYFIVHQDMQDCPETSMLKGQKKPSWKTSCDLTILCEQSRMYTEAVRPTCQSSPEQDTPTVLDLTPMSNRVRPEEKLQVEVFPSEDPTACGSAVSAPACPDTSPDRVARETSDLVVVVMSPICRSVVCQKRCPILISTFGVEDPTDFEIQCGI